MIQLKASFVSLSVCTLSAWIPLNVSGILKRNALRLLKELRMLLMPVSSSLSCSKWNVASLILGSSLPNRTKKQMKKKLDAEKFNCSSSGAKLSSSLAGFDISTV